MTVNKAFPMQATVPESNPQNLLKNLDIIAWTCNPSAGEYETDFLGHHGQPD